MKKNSNLMSQKEHEKDLLAEIDNLQIFLTHIQVGGVNKSFDEISHINGGSNTISVNLVAAIKKTWISIDFSNGESYCLEEERGVLGQDRHEKIAQCLSILRQITFKSRLAGLVSTTTKLGAIQIGIETNEVYTLIGAIANAISKPQSSPVYLLKNGNITNGELTLNLKRCRTDGILELGIERTNKYAPEQVYACHQRSLFEKSRNMALKFDLGAEYEADVVLALLNWLAQPNNNLASP